METMLTFKNERSDKFWKINVEGSVFTVTYGKAGTTGAVNVKEFATEESCQRAADKLIQSKLKKGYIRAETNEIIMKESGMTEAYFWELLEISQKKGDDIDEQLEWLVSCLSRKSVRDIMRFHYILNYFYDKSYTSNLWAAASIIMGGCSDDSFDYFRAWLVFLGRLPYHIAIQDPESIIPYLEKIEEEGDVPELEELLYVAMEAYEEKTGHDEEQFYKMYAHLTGDTYDLPEMALDWEEDDEEELKMRFPLLWERYSNNPLG